MMMYNIDIVSGENDEQEFENFEKTLIAENNRLSVNWNKYFVFKKAKRIFRPGNRKWIYLSRQSKS